MGTDTARAGAHVPRGVPWWSRVSVAAVTRIARGRDLERTVDVRRRIARHETIERMTWTAATGHGHRVWRGRRDSVARAAGRLRPIDEGPERLRIGTASERHAMAVDGAPQPIEERRDPTRARTCSKGQLSREPAVQVSGILGCRRDDVALAAGDLGPPERVREVTPVRADPPRACLGLAGDTQRRRRIARRAMANVARRTHVDRPVDVPLRGDEDIRGTHHHTVARAAVPTGRMISGGRQGMAGAAGRLASVDACPVRRRVVAPTQTGTVAVDITATRPIERRRRAAAGGASPEDELGGRRRISVARRRDLFRYQVALATFNRGVPARRTQVRLVSTNSASTGVAGPAQVDRWGGIAVAAMTSTAADAQIDLPVEVKLGTDEGAVGSDNIRVAGHAVRACEMRRRWRKAMAGPACSLAPVDLGPDR